jgi:hypothetical protein
MLSPTRREVKTKSFSRRLCARGLPTPSQETKPVLLDSPPATKEGAERRKAHCPANVRGSQTSLRDTGATSSATRLRALFRGHARLPALTLAAFTTGFYPDGSAPEPGFPKPQARRCFACLHSSLRLSALRADRSLCRSTGAPEPPECGLAIPPAGTAPRSTWRHAGRQAPSVSELSLT